MKKQLQFLTLFLLSMFATAQVQIGSDLKGSAANDTFGKSVSINNDGSIMAIGIPGNNAGTVRIYKNQSGTWSQIGSDIVGAANGDKFGASVSLNSNGTIVAIGSPGNTADYVRIYENQAGTWTQIANIDGGNSGYEFGTSVSLNADGTTVAIGAPSYYDASYNYIGQVRVYKNQAGTWTQIGAPIEGVDDGDECGRSVSLSNDGTVLAVGTPFAMDVNSSPTGHVRIYKNIAGTWTQLGGDIENPTDPNYESETGKSVSLNADGTIIAVGERSASSNTYTYAGQVRIFKYQSNAWAQIGNTLKGTQDSDFFGDAVSLNDDGTIVGIGAYANDTNGEKAGKAQVYQNQSGTWTQVGATTFGVAAEDWLGAAVSINGDGSKFIVGTPNFDDATNGVNSGFVRALDFNTVLSVQNNSFGNQFSVYPNPSNGVSTIKLGKAYNKVSIQVFDVLGKQKLLQQYYNVDQVRLNTQQFTVGVYILKVTSANKEAAIKLIVK